MACKSVVVFSLLQPSTMKQQPTNGRVVGPSPQIPAPLLVDGGGGTNGFLGLAIGVAPELGEPEKRQNGTKSIIKGAKEAHVAHRGRCT